MFVRKKMQTIFAVITVILLYLFLIHIGVGCPIKFFTGVSCAGCGMTRAWLSFLDGDVAGAFSYHPLFIIPAVIAIAFIFRRLFRKIFNLFLMSAVVLFLVVYLFRMFNPTDFVVVFNPENGFFYKVINTILNNI